MNVSVTAALTLIFCRGQPVVEINHQEMAAAYAKLVISGQIVKINATALAWA
jgi:hypothetical protein